MKRIFTILLLTISMFSCSDYLKEQHGGVQESQLSNSEKIKISAEDTVLNANDASIVALLERYGDTPTKGGATDEVRDVVTIRNKEGEPVMYAVNFVGGGYTVVSATKKFYPILARAEEGSFSEDVYNTGASVLLAEFEDYIEFAATLPEDSLRAIDALWDKYEEFKPNVPVSTKSGDLADLVMGSIAQWQAQGLEYYFLSEGNVPNYLPESEYQRFVEAARYNANPNYDFMENSVIIVDRADSYTQKGPLVTTAWHQRSPYNIKINDVFGTDNSRELPAGCVAIATGQIMAFHKFPGNIPWSNILGGDDTAVSNFVYDVAQGVDTDYGYSGSGANINDAKSYLESKGYNVQKVNHSTGITKASLTVGRPVYMRGEKSVGNGHAWVCDGYVEESTEITYRLLVVSYAEPLQYETVTTDYIYNVGTTSFYMNWGWGSRSALYTAIGNVSDWFSSDKMYTGDRENLVHIYPNAN